MADILNANLDPAYLPRAIGDLLVDAVTEASRAAEVASVDRISTASIAYPVLTDDVNVVWLAEADTYPTDAPGLTEVVVTPGKVGGLTRVSEEAWADSPNAPATVTGSLARSIARQVDRAFVTTVAAPAPQGLSTVEPGSTVDAGAATDLDFVVAAAAEIENLGGSASALLVSPDVAAHLATLKAGTGSNVPLLGSDPTAPTRRVAQGLPVVVFRDLPNTTGYVIDREAVKVVFRNDPTVTVSTDRYFDQGLVAVKGMARVGFGLLSPSRVARVTFAIDAA